MQIPVIPAAIAGRIADILRRDERGATAVEYGIIVALVAGVLVGSLALFGSAITAMFNTVITAL